MSMFIRHLEDFDVGGGGGGGGGGVIVLTHTVVSCCTVCTVMRRDRNIHTRTCQDVETF